MGHATNAEMRADHRLWTFEHDSWRKDVTQWHADVQNVQAILKDVHLMLEEHDSALKSHVQTINNHEQSEREHETALSTSDLLASPSTSIDPLAGNHIGEAKSHATQRDAHERMKKHHYILIGRWNAFLGALREAM
jgi:hypothetical protein